MSPYLKFIRKKYIKLIRYLPFDIFLLFPREERKEEAQEGGNHEGGEDRENGAAIEADDVVEDDEDVETQILDRFVNLLNNTHWCQSKYAKQIFQEASKDASKFRSDFIERTAKGRFMQIEKTIRLLEQFLSQTEIEQLLSDFQRFANDIADIYAGTDGDQEVVEKIREVLEQLKQFFSTVPSTPKSLSILLTELPFQVFILVADADDEVDKFERGQYMKILRDRDWCQSDCAQLLFVATAYSYSEFFTQFNRGKFKKSLKQVKRTLRLVERMFSKQEVKLLKLDLSRLAKEIAKASGGFGGFRSICKEEQEVLDELESYFGDLSDAKKTRRKKDGDEMFADTADVSVSTGEDSGTQPENVKLRDQPRLDKPKIGAVLHAGGKEQEVSVVNLSQNSVWCKVDFQDEYTDLMRDVRLSLRISQGSETVEMEQIRCKALRSEFLSWNTDCVPTSLKIAWMLVDVPKEDQKKLNLCLEKMIEERKKKEVAGKPVPDN
ncbi:MAG: hypothetical protein GY866_15795 [Proteobacteria bacterium]|nr:hypothetical protein [Pseudomonadota bacterium]